MKRMMFISNFTTIDIHYYAFYYLIITTKSLIAIENHHQ